ncbi:thioredoxin family protein [Rubritalea spongiae]|uniref:Thioredoxin family protein n=1 Tax=Rubritalea spongiae TaxID=430797 RepID=A0ABW5E550_9BACT
MLKRSTLFIFGGVSLALLPSCDKLEGIVNQATDLVGAPSVFEPSERREGIAKPHEASVDDVKLWVAEPNVLVVLDFYSDQCPPCRAMAPHIEALAKQYGDKAAVMRLNVGKPGSVAQMAHDEYGVTRTPTLKFFFNGREVKSMLGAQSKEKLDAVFSTYTAKIDGEYVMREGDMPGKKTERTVEDMMQRISKKELPQGITRVKVPDEAKDVTGDLKSVLGVGEMTPVKSSESESPKN